MSLDTWLVYLGTILVFMVTPGPSHMLMISVSMGNGFKRSLATAAGDLSANAIQILMAGFGLAAIITTSRYGFVVIKWLGVAYLIWMGIRTIFRSFGDNANTSANPEASLTQLWLRGFITSAANPKAVVFFAAVDGLFLMTYGLGSDWLAQKLKHQYKALVERVSGAGLVAAAILLGLKTTPER